MHLVILLAIIQAISICVVHAALQTFNTLTAHSSSVRKEQCILHVRVVHNASYSPSPFHNNSSNLAVL